jgi:hypothetical protein
VSVRKQRDVAVGARDQAVHSRTNLVPACDRGCRALRLPLGLAEQVGITARKMRRPYCRGGKRGSFVLEKSKVATQQMPFPNKNKHQLSS